MSKKAALGKGLGALISGANDTNRENSRFSDYQKNISSSSSSKSSATNPASISEIPLAKISANPHQPRTTFDEEALAELSESIKTLGLIQPITVRSVGSEYQLISGERRLRAAQIAGLTHIPAYIRKADDQGMLEMAIVENIQRENLDAIEVAISFQRLIEDCELTQEAMANRVGKKRATVTNYLRLLKLPVEIQHSLKTGDITMGHAKCILSLSDVKQQLKLCDLIQKSDLSVRQTESKVQEILNKKQIGLEDDKSMDLPETHYRVLEIIGKFFDNNISLKRSKEGKGSFTIPFKSDAEVENFLKVIETLNS